MRVVSVPYVCLYSYRAYTRFNSYIHIHTHRHTHIDNYTHLHTFPHTLKNYQHVFHFTFELASLACFFPNVLFCFLFFFAVYNTNFAPLITVLFRQYQRPHTLKASPPPRPLATPFAAFTLRNYAMWQCYSLLICGRKHKNSQQLRLQEYPFI